MKLFTLALGASLITAVPSLAAPDYKSDPYSRKEYLQKPITGRVTNEKGEPLAGVTVQVKGLRTSAVTNADGVFTIDVPGDAATLVFSFIGMERKEVSIAGKTDFQIQLKTTDATLSDVVVVGYAAQKKAHVTGAITSIQATEIEDLPVSNLGTALQGRLLGVSVSGGTNRPGVPAAIKSRNPATYSKDAGGVGPLYVIDGVIQIAANGQPDATLFNTIDASEVESITVLKDASAAVYGSRGAQGVVIVTTKRGKAGAPRISYSGSYAVNDELYRTRMMNAFDFAQYVNVANGPNGARRTATDKNYFFSPDEMAHYRNVDYNWLDSAWKPAHTMRHTLNVSGGSDKATYFAGISYYDQTGNLASLDYNKWTFRAGADVNVAAGLKTGLQVSGQYDTRIKTFNKVGGENDENDYRNLLLTPRFVPMYLNGYPVKIPGTSSDGLSQYHFYEIERLGNLATTKSRNLLANMYVEYEVPFVKGLKARASYARNFNHSIGGQVGTSYFLYDVIKSGANGHIYDTGTSVKLPGSLYKNGDRLYYSNTNGENVQSNFNISYTRQFGMHHVSALASAEKAEAFSDNQVVWKDNVLQSTNGQFGSAIGAIDGNTTGSESGNLGYIGRVNYAYGDKYLAEFLFRTDASTKFAPEHYWGRFYSGSAGWVISKENFFRVNFIDFLKIRYSAGLLGKDDTKAWQWRQRFTFQNGKGAVFGGNAATSTGQKMEASPNRDATWSQEFKNNLGIDARFLKERLSLTLETFYNIGTDLLIERTESVPLTVGGTVAAENWGKVDYFGYEVGLEWKEKIGRNFTYGINTMFTWYDDIWKQGNFGPTDYLYPWKRHINQSTDIGVWGFDYLGIFKSQADIDAYIAKYNIKEVKTSTTAASILANQLRPGMMYYRDVRGKLQPDGKFAGPDGIIDENDQIQLAKKVDNHYGISVVLKANYRGIGLDAVFTGSFGGWAEIDGGTRKPMQTQIDRAYQSRPVIWNNIYDSLTNPNGTMPNPYWESLNSVTSNFWRVNSFRVGLRNINLNYSLPKRATQFARISNARITVTALNPFLIYNPYNYKSPDGAYDVYPDLRTLSVGLNLTL